MLRWLAPLLAFALFAVADPARAQRLTPTQQPLPGSGFQGGDGDQADAPPLLDWAGAAGLGRVLHLPDPDADDDAFAGGTKDLEPEDWEFDIEDGGVTPGGSNIRDAWFSLEQSAGETFLYLGGLRESETGTTFLTFELNRDGRLWNNGRARVPCRRDGDILVTFEPHGNEQTVTVKRWDTRTTDYSTGCARTGRLETADLRPGVDVQGAFNAAALTSSLPGSSTTIAARLFGESALNLSAIAEREFGDDCLAFTSVWLHSRSSDSDNATLKDVVMPRPLDVRSCSASGTKFLDADADGVRDPREPGLAGFKIFADYDNDGRHDGQEPFAITDSDGDYVVDDIRRSRYTLRETTLTGTNPRGWICSYPATTAPGGLFPCAWSVDREAEPFARGRDFGNWRPAHLTLRKQVFPSDDPTQFQLVHPGRPNDPFEVGDGDAVGGNIDLRPGTYTVSEIPNAAFETTVTCAVGSARARATSTVTLAAGDSAVCTFYNVRSPQPAIAIDKVGPTEAIAGETMRFTLYVTNIGDVAFDEDGVEVSDDQCDQPPRRTQPTDDPRLDPGETWVYTCTDSTPPPSSACVDRTIVNVATVEAGGADDSDSIETVVSCPHPAIELEKVGPASAPAGSTIRYYFYAYNTGDTAFDAGDTDFTISDTRCDSTPALVAKRSSSGGRDSSPASFDPGDVWVFSCASETPRPSECVPSVIVNTATLQLTWADFLLIEHDSVETELTCDPPAPEPPVEPLPSVPDAPPVAPPGVDPLPVEPPQGGVAGTASIVPPRLPSCLRRGSIVRLQVARARTAAFFVGGRRIRGIGVLPLERQVVVRVRRDLRPGRYRVTVRIVFERGAGTKPVAMTGWVRTCAAQRPRVTG